MALVSQNITSTGGGSWTIPGVAFVDPLATGIGVVGDGNSPFSTVALALAEAPDAIFLLPGNYSETVNLSSGMTYYSYPGVTFVNGGLRVAENQDGTKWLGYSEFIGNFFQVYLNANFSMENMYLEFDHIEETGTGSRCLYVDPDSNASNVVIKVRRDIISFGGNGHGVRFQNNANVNLSVDGEISGSYSPLSTIFLSGKCIVNCPTVRCTDGGFAGNVAGFKAAIWNQLSSGGSFVVNADVVQETSGVSGGTTSGLYTDGSGDVTINGAINAGALRGVVNASTGNVVINGNVESTGTRAFEATNGSMVFKSIVISQATTSAMSGSSIVWVNGCQVNSSATDHIIDVTSNSNELYIHNTVLQGTSGLCVEHNATTATIGFANARSNLSNSALTDAYSPTGFLQQTGITTPTFI